MLAVGNFLRQPAVIPDGADRAEQGVYGCPGARPPLKLLMDRSGVRPNGSEGLRRGFSLPGRTPALKYRIELRERDKAGALIVSPMDAERHPTLVRAWSAGVEAARSLSAARGIPVCLRVLDHADQLAVAGNVHPPADAVA